MSNRCKKDGKENDLFSAVLSERRVVERSEEKCLLLIAKNRNQELKTKHCKTILTNAVLKSIQ